MKNQNLPVTVTISDLEAVGRSLKALRQTMPFLVTLSPSERRGTPLGPQKLALAETCLIAARENRSILPPSFDFDQFEHNVRITAGLHKNLNELKQLASDVQDTLIAVAKQTLKSSQQVRALVRTAAKTTPGLQLLAQQLSNPASHPLGKETPLDSMPSDPPPSPPSDVKAA